MKKIIAIILAGILIVTGVLVLPIGHGDGTQPASVDILAGERVFAAALSATDTNPEIIITQQSISETLSGQNPREGYILAPVLFGLEGIDTLSPFILRASDDYAAQLPIISIDGQPQPLISREDNNTFIVSPAAELMPNSVYIFRLERESAADITWAFQTAKRFEITGTLPGNQATNVPVRTGIEISFSYGENHDISEHFSIHPNVEGEFIHRGSTVIFMPGSPLEYGQIYTVTIAPGLSAPGGRETISSDRVFAFETIPETGTTMQRDWNAQLHFSGRYVEFPSFAAPSVGFWLNYNRDQNRPVIEMSAYRFTDRASAVAAINRLASAPHWSRFSFEDYHVDTSDLEQVFTRTIREAQQDEQQWNEVFTFPNTLPAGFYLLNALTGGSDGEHSQLIVQITDIAVQVIADDNRTLVWVNDMTTGGPAAGARVFDVITGKTYETSGYGIAVVERGMSEGEYLIIEANNMESVVFVHPTGFQSFWDSGSWGRMPVFTDSMGRSTGRMWNPWGVQSANSQYWAALQLDRTLFQRSDTLSLWGFVQNRRHDENIRHVSAVLTEHSFWRWDEHEPDTLHRQNIPVRNGAYSAEIRLPHLDPGSYELAIYHGNIQLSSTFFSVMDYVTPPYRLSVEADRAAIFAGEEVEFSVRTEFFEGTPVPDLDVSYSFWGWELRTPGQSRAQTNAEGLVQVSASPTAQSAAVQGERSLHFAVDATLPEIGWVHEFVEVRVFVNDIHLRPTASRDGTAATLSVDVHDITLERLNDGSNEDWSDFLAEPRRGQQISVEIVEVYWERVAEGEFYDHITRQTRTRYRHVQRENSLERFELTTDGEGMATRDFTVPDNYRRSYEARLTTTDGNGRTIRQEVFIGTDWARFFQNADNERLFLYGANIEGYDIGDDVELTIMRGTDMVTQGNFLFVVVADGILSYHMGSNPLNMTFAPQHVPNAQVFAYHFNGHIYNAGGDMSARLHYNPDEHELVINIETCQNDYRPGDSATFTISTTDRSGNPKAANVNISLVDEALFALMDYRVDTLAMLYGNTDDNLRFSLATHRTFASEGIEGDFQVNLESATWFFGGVQRETFVHDAYMAPALAASAAAPMAEMGWNHQSTGGGIDTTIRQRFEDTAIFASIRTNPQGEANLSFTLPDNITSWRISASAISEDLYAGNAFSNLRVTLPMFLNYTLNDTFLVGDVPAIGVNAFGSTLIGGEQVEFSLWRESAPNDVRTATGVAFERVNIPLWEKTEEGFGAIIIHAEVLGAPNSLSDAIRHDVRTATGVAFERINIPLWEKNEEGFGAIIIHAEVLGAPNSLSDAIRHEYQVINSHRLVDTAVFYEVTPETVFDINQSGLTNITFTDRGRGQFLNDLLGLRHTWHSGVRLEALIARREADALIRKHFPDIRLFGDPVGFDIQNYQTDSGGIAILPYTQAELEVTVKLLPFIKDEVNLPALRAYLQNALENSTSDNKMLALYGLALLGEPVLFELQSYAGLETLSLRNTAYVALGLAAIGEIQAARDLYTERILPHIQRISGYYRVNVGANRAEILNATSVTALLAAQLGTAEAGGLWAYVSNAGTAAPQPRSGQRLDDFLMLNIERLQFISHEIENHTADASITYTLFGETITRGLGHGGQFTLRIPAANMHNFNLISTTGEVAAVSIIRRPLEDMEQVENDISVRREFFRAGSNTPATSFEQDELIRVQITVDYSARDLSGTYIITDFLPAGLSYVANSARFAPRGQNPGWHAWATTEGQRVTFFDHNGRFDRIHTYFYYARVINPGTFRAEGTIVQSMNAREYMVVGTDAVLTIAI